VIHMFVLFEAETIDCSEVVTLVRRGRYKCLSLGSNSKATDRIVLSTDGEWLAPFGRALIRMILELFCPPSEFKGVVLVGAASLWYWFRKWSTILCMQCIDDCIVCISSWTVDHVPCYFLLLLLRWWGTSDQRQGVSERYCGVLGKTPTNGGGWST